MLSGVTRLGRRKGQCEARADCPESPSSRPAISCQSAVSSASSKRTAAALRRARLYEAATRRRAKDKRGVTRPRSGPQHSRRLRSVRPPFSQSAGRCWREDLAGERLALGFMVMEAHKPIYIPTRCRIWRIISRRRRRAEILLRLRKQTAPWATPPRAASFHPPSFAPEVQSTPERRKARGDTAHG
jgi:hypothetical protein